MKITCDRQSFLAAFQTAATVVPLRSPKPILQNLKLEIGDGSALLSATDMEVAIRIEVSGIAAERPGTVLLPVARFGSILRECADKKLEIEADSQGTVVKGERSEFKLPGANPDEFPVVAQFEEDKYHEVAARLFKELIRRTLFATDTESSRYALGGVLLEMNGDQITAVATDGRRLAKMEGPAQPVNGHRTGDATTIVPARSMQLIERALTEADAEIHVAGRANDLLLRTPRAVIYSRLVEGRFPNWRDVLPVRPNALRVQIMVGPMYAAVRQAAVVASEESRGIDFTFGDGNLVLSGSTAEVGQSRVELPIPYKGKPITVSLDHRFVADFLKVLDPEKVFTLEIESRSAAVLCSTDDGYGYVIMPLAREQR